MHDPVSDLQEAQECALWEEENGIYGYGEMDKYDDGELVPQLFYDQNKLIWRGLLFCSILQRLIIYLRHS